MTAADPTTELPGELGAERQSWRPAAVLARAFDITQGQAATMILAIVIALVLSLVGLPPVLRHRNAGDSRALEGPVASSPRPAEPSGSQVTAPSTEPAAPALPSGGSGSAAGASPSTGSTSTGSGTVDDTSGPSNGDSGVPTPATGEMARFASVDSPGAPHGVAVGEDGTVYVATNNGTSQGERGPSKIFSFDTSGTAGRTLTVAGQPGDHALGLTGLTLDGDGGLLALDAATGRILRFQLGSGRQSTIGEIIDLPACGLVVAAPSGCEPGVQDQGPEPRALVRDGSGNVFVTDATQGVIWRLPAGGGKAEPWATSNMFGSDNGLSGIAIAADGALLVASPQALDPAAALGGAVYRIPIDAAGRAGSPELVVSFPPGEEPAGIAGLPDGSLVVALRGANAVALVDPEGNEVRRVTGSAGDVALDAPTGVAFHGQTLLVTNQAPSTKEAWAVLAVGVR